MVLTPDRLFDRDGAIGTALFINWVLASLIFWVGTALRLLLGGPFLSSTAGMRRVTLPSAVIFWVVLASRVGSLGGGVRAVILWVVLTSLAGGAGGVIAFIFWVVTGELVLPD